MKKKTRSKVISGNDLFGPPPILGGEEAAYDELIGRVYAAVKPSTSFPSRPNASNCRHAISSLALRARSLAETNRYYYTLTRQLGVAIVRSGNPRRGSFRETRIRPARVRLCIPDLSRSWVCDRAWSLSQIRSFSCRFCNRTPGHRRSRR